ncbi:LysR family transcriptional regulator [Pusillimonas sp. ANT_WB101]|uniref:LysR family transcriptional regulator n=1 Tax=Pusillimonas sp. ANT_WB101 TaxID=2597356 RepID=UPI0011EF1BEA|nr:LysR family transcriptional regulator [Pusillimonas sp. ANT_WB101]KAA0892805.1 LysR family transcriptional regulator [Pusillimonas sp. ANT_WB101]
MNITLRQLRAAMAVAHHLSFRRAAMSIHVSQPALSSTISELEKTLGISLFDRTSRSVVLTDSGAAFLQGAARILEDVDRLMLDTTSLVQSRRGRVIVSSVSSIAGRVMSKAMQLCTQKHPALEVIVKDDVATQVLSSVRAGEADFAVTVKPSTLDADMLFEPCMEDPFFVVCTRDHAIAQMQSITWRQLEGETLIALSTTSGMHQIVHDELLRKRIAVFKSIPVSHLSTVHGMLEAGLGISVLPCLALPVKDHPTLISVPLIKPQLTRTLGIYRRRDRSLSPAAQGLVEIINIVLSQWHTLDKTQSPSTVT